MNSTITTALFDGNSTLNTTLFDDMSTLNATLFDTNQTVTKAPSSGDGGGPIMPGVHTDVKEWIWKIVPPIVVILGTFGNGLTIIVLLRQIKNLSSTAVYLLALACSDLMIIYLGPIRQWIQYIWKDGNTDVRLQTDAGCRTSLFFTYFSFQLSSWLLVAVTIERVVSVMLPHKVKLGCTTMKAGITVLIIIGCLVPLNAHYFYGYRLRHNPANPRAPYVCGPLPEMVDYQTFLYKYWPWVDFAVGFAVPFAIMLIGNILIIVSLKRQATRRKKMSMTQNEKEGRPVTVMLIVLCVIYAVCLIPYNVYFIVLPYLREEAFKLPFNEMIRRMEYLLFIHAVVSCLSYINSTTNFILYFLSGSRFRKEVRNLFTCKGAGKQGVFGSSTAGRSTSFTNTRTSSNVNGGPKHSSITSAGKVAYDANGIEAAPPSYENLDISEKSEGSMYPNKQIEDTNDETGGDGGNFTDIRCIDGEGSTHVTNGAETELLANHL